MRARRTLPDARAMLLAMLVVAAAATSGCTDPGAAIKITGARAFRDPGKRVVVDIDLVAREELGRSVGVYCTRVTFAGQAQPYEECKADLEDGDRKTERVVSDGDIGDNAAIDIRVRLGTNDVGWSLVAPPH